MVGITTTNERDALRGRTAIESLLQGIGRAARRESSRTTFLKLWLSGVVAAVGARSGNVYEHLWEGKRRSVQSVNDRNHAEEYDAVHACALRTERSQWSKSIARKNPPSVGFADDVVFVVPFQLYGVRLTVELRFSDSRTNSQRRSCEEIMARAEESVAEFFVRERLLTLECRIANHDQLLRFVRQVHQNPNCKHVALSTVEEVRRLHSFDRVTFLIRKGNRFAPLAVSGSAVFDPRSAAVKALTALAEKATAIGETVKFAVSESSDHLPPQIARGFADCVDTTMAHTTIVVPLFRQRQSTAQPAFAAVILERFCGSVALVREADLEALTTHAAGALEIAVEHEQILFHSWRRKLGAASNIVFPNHRARGWASLAFLASVIALAAIPANHSVSASGVIRPAERRDVFAPFDGYVDAVHVRHGDHISRGAVLLELSDPQLDSMIQQCEGDRNSARERYRALDRSGIGATLASSPVDELRISGERDALKAQLETSETKLRQLREMKSRLIITSPLDGEVTTWDVSRTLDHRPVRRGQSLLQLANTAGDWEIEAYFEQRRLSHLLHARDHSDAPLLTSVRIPSDPSMELAGVVQEVGDTVRYIDGMGDVVPVTIRVIGAECPLRQGGGAVSVKVSCGRRSLAYVWFHELIDYVRIRLWSAFA